MENNEPRYCDVREQQIPAFQVNKREVWPSKMFTIKLELQDFIKRHPDIPVYDASQGDGGSSLGGIPKDELAEALKRYLPDERTTQYGNPIGREDVRKAIFENYYRFDPETGLTPDHIIIGDGGRDILQKWYQVVVQSTGSFGNNILVSAAPWGSYPQGPYINGMNVLMAPGSIDNGFKITPEAIDKCIEFSARDNRKIAGLIITSPDNPTGNYMDADYMISLIEHASERGIPHIFADLIYQSVTDPEVGRYNVNGIINRLSEKAKSRVSFMDGLTKVAGASNLRNAHLVCTTDEFSQKMKGVATHTVIPNAIGEAVALEIYSQREPTEHPWMQKVILPTSESRRIVREKLTELGYTFVADQGYYAFIRVKEWFGKKIPAGEQWQDSNGNTVDTINDVVTLKSYLTTRCGLAVIHGTVFKQPDYIRFSYANSPEYTGGSIMRLHESLGQLDN